MICCPARLHRRIWNVSDVNIIRQPFFIPSAIILVLSIPLILELIPRQGIYGVRTLQTLANDQIWYAANRVGGWLFLVSSFFYLFIAWMFPCVTSTRTDFLGWVAHLLSFALPLILSVLFIKRYLDQQSKE